MAPVEAHAKTKKALAALEARAPVTLTMWRAPAPRTLGGGGDGTHPGKRAARIGRQETQPNWLASQPVELSVDLPELGRNVLKCMRHA